MPRRRSFKELYPVKDSYRRYNPVGTSRSTPPRGYKTEEGKSWRIMQGIPGFSLLDYAFRDAAYTANHQTNGKSNAMNEGYYSWSSLGVTHKPDNITSFYGSPAEASKIVEKAARFYGALDVGFTALDKRWFFSHKRGGKPIVFEDVEEAYETEEKAVVPNSYSNVVVMTVPIDFEETQYTPTPVFAAGGMAYSRMHILAGTVAEFIRGLGYHALPSGNDLTLNVPLALQAGLGHVGRMNRVITWKHGPLVKICKVYTDLPLEQSQSAPEGILEFCEVCKKCAKHCPSGSISEEPMSFDAPPGANPSIYRWYCDEDKCREYWDEVGTSCTICFRVCAFAKEQGAIHDMVRWFIRNVPQLNRLWVFLDDFIGYGKMKNPREYWD